MRSKDEDHSKEKKSLEAQANSKVIVHVLEELFLFLYNLKNS
jgi:hypothetical protein